MLNISISLVVFVLVSTVGFIKLVDYHSRDMRKEIHPFSWVLFACMSVTSLGFTPDSDLWVSLAIWTFLAVAVMYIQFGWPPKQSASSVEPEKPKRKTSDVTDDTAHPLEIWQDGENYHRYYFNLSGMRFFLTYQYFQYHTSPPGITALIFHDPEHGVLEPVYYLYGKRWHRIDEAWRYPFDEKIEQQLENVYQAIMTTKPRPSHDR